MDMLLLYLVLSLVTNLPVDSQLVYSFCSTSSTQTVPGQCRPVIKCISFFQNLKRLETKTCRLQSGEIGVCCPDFILRNDIQFSVSPNPSPRPLLQSPPEPPVHIPPLKTEDIQMAAKNAVRIAEDRRAIHQRLSRSGFIIESKSPTSKHRQLQKSSLRAQKMSIQAAKLIDTSTNLVDSFNLSPEQGTFALGKFDLEVTGLMSDNLEGRCNPVGKNLKFADCTTASKRYRTIDGSCNNVKNPHWGQSNVALIRLLPPSYEDGVSFPRGSTGNTTTLGSNLPSPRLVSSTLMSGEDNPSTDFTLVLMQWGQFLDHDLTHTPMNKAQPEKEINDEDDEFSFDAKDEIKCCTTDGQFLPEDLRHPECFPISIPANDPFHGGRGRRCMEFVRSMPAERPKCNLGPREQVNQITSYLDGSNVYGSDASESRKLRLGRGGRLRVTKYRKGELLPLNPDECSDNKKNHYCFAAGDVRVNEQPQLALMHTIWLREHNRLALQLSLLNPHWDDETIYQEARKIVGAEMQHITYNEWLPIILGSQFTIENGLKPLSQGFSDQYNPEVDSSISNEFATAAFRFGHSLVQGLMESFNGFGTPSKSILMHEHQFSPFELYDDQGIDGFLRGLTTQPAQKFDPKFSKELTDKLFQGSTSDDGMDLVALNLQRGRDHGLAPYLKWRDLCGLPAVNGWRDLTKVVSSPELIARLQQLYGSVDRIDLFVGGVLEKPEPGTLIGPTFQCIIGDQFRRLKMGDRFFYEEGNYEGAFTEAQLESIKSVSLARILCDNSNDLDQMQPLAFKAPKDMNSKVSCFGTSIPRLDLVPWKEDPKSKQFIR